ncbi:hypothetical protein N7484_000009 [Penicillium longicatenatum]|nr:hypothetical protein N7484_000009 [Penicillium longicatenatum]
MGVVRALGRPSFQRTWSKGHTTRSTGGGSWGGASPSAFFPPPSDSRAAASQLGNHHHIAFSPPAQSLRPRPIRRRLASSANTCLRVETRYKAPLQAPGTAGSLDGEVLTNKSSQGRADAQRLVATRPLDRLHDPLGHFSRLQRIYPRAR